MVDRVFNRFALPQNVKIVDDNGMLTQAWLNVFNQFLRLSNAVSAQPQVTDDAAAMTRAPSVAPTAIAPISVALAKAGATYTAAEIVIAMDELRTAVSGISTAIQALQTAQNLVIAGQKSSGQMEP
jgi:hypothetical protein